MQLLLVLVLVLVDLPGFSGLGYGELNPTGIALYMHTEIAHLAAQIILYCTQFLLSYYIPKSSWLYHLVRLWNFRPCSKHSLCRSTQSRPELIFSSWIIFFFMLLHFPFYFLHGLLIVSLCSLGNMIISIVSNVSLSLQLSVLRINVPWTI